MNSTNIMPAEVKPNPTPVDIVYYLLYTVDCRLVMYHMSIDGSGLDGYLFP